VYSDTEADKTDSHLPFSE